MSIPPPRNALAKETSPYLLQHAGNPVNWYPWGSDGLGVAEQKNKPILLSIGYSACHWCHVMAHESFEDEETAALMNKYFVNIKVDREERPDLDKIYQLAHQLITQRSGGWPLTMFLTPGGQTPFFGGTYFPRGSRYGLPGFKDLLRHIAELYTKDPNTIQEQGKAVVATLERIIAQENTPGGHIEIGSVPLLQARKQIGENYDKQHGGFSGAPKFPHPTTIERLFRHYAAADLRGESDVESLEMGLHTLACMARGGIYDHLGGGFCRYSVDAEWAIPHFEKMLYDNGPLLALYCEAWRISGETGFRKVATETADWIMREMQSAEGGYYSSLDADSEGEEGKFYVWTPEELREHLAEQGYSLFARRYGLDRTPNFEGKWHLNDYTSVAKLCEDSELSEAEVETLLDQAKTTLLGVRNRRVWPGRDEKVLTSWNGLMIKGMSIAGRMLERQDYVQSAQSALDFIHNTMWREGRLLATYKDGKAHLNAYLDDYAFLIDAILSLLQARWRDGELDFAIELADSLLDRFEDKEQGGFFFTSHDHEQLIQRTKSVQDDSIPAGAGIAAYVLIRLGSLLGETRYLDAAERAIRSAWTAIQRYPSAHNAFLLALEEHLDPPEIVVLRGEPGLLRTWRQRCEQRYAPRRMVIPIPHQVTNLPALLAEHKPSEQPVAYLCEGTRCLPPITNLDALCRRLEEPRRARS